MANILNIYDKDKGKYVAIPSIQGESAYEIAVKHGYEGTEEEWAKELSSGETINVYKFAKEEDSYDDYYYSKEVKVDFELPELPTYEGGTRFYCEHVPIVAGETDFFNEITVLAGEKEIGFESDDTYKTQGKLYVNSSYESFNDDVYAPVYGTKTGVLDDYMIRSVVREKYRREDPAMILAYKETPNDPRGDRWILAYNESGLVGTIIDTYRVWVYPVEFFEPYVNGEYKAVDIKITETDTQFNDFDMVLVTEEEYKQLIYGVEGDYGLFKEFKKKSTTDYGIPVIDTNGYTSNSYLIVRYDGNAGDECGNISGLNPFLHFTVHSCAYDYLKYKVWTTSMDGSESSSKYTISLTQPLKYGEYIRYSSEPLYSKHSRTLYKKDEFVNLYGVERFTGEYDNDDNPIFKKTLHIPAPEKSATTTINRYKNSEKHNITGLIKFYEITPTWSRTTVDMQPHVYTGNCFALDENIQNFGVYKSASNGLDSEALSWNYLQVYPTETTIIADRGCNVWCYDCDVVLRYTRELTEEDFDKYHI